MSLDVQARWERLRRAGLVRGLATSLVVRLETLAYERRFGLDTGGVVHTDTERTRCGGYEAVRWRVLPRALPVSEVDERDVLLDAGCGKGRAVFIAARRYAFSRIVGFDFSPELVAIAERNVMHVRDRLRCKRIELLVADARSFRIPDDVTVVTMYNPFNGDVLDAFVDRLLESLDREPRRLRIVYVNPTEPGAFERTGRFVLRRATAGGVNGPAARLYEHEPAAPSPTDQL